MVACIADYAQAHRNVDYLHVWLDDSYNNKCECDRCRTARTFDFYVQILNALDAELTSRGLDTRIVFLAYSDLLMPPLKEWLERPERFTFMYANSRGDYSQALEPVGEDVPPVQFELNRMGGERPKDVAQVAATLPELDEADRRRQLHLRVTTAARRRSSAPASCTATCATCAVSA